MHAFSLCITLANVWLFRIYDYLFQLTSQCNVMYITGAFDGRFCLKHLALHQVAIFTMKRKSSASDFVAITLTQFHIFFSHFLCHFTKTQIFLSFLLSVISALNDCFIY